MQPKFKVVIPARYASTRLPGKPLLPIAGKPMIVHVCERALEAGATDVIVATDDQRIYDAAENTNVRAVMTSADHASGTERIAEVIRTLGWEETEIIVNLQGDEPLIPVNYVRDVADALAGTAGAGVATLAAPIIDVAELFNPDAVKVVLNKQGFAQYFSRAPIPWDRGNFNRHGGGHLPENITCLRHIGIYAYRAGFINKYITWSCSPLERAESLEQLRILWHGESILVETVDEIPEAGVDTEKDLQRVEKTLLKLLTSRG